MMFHFDFINVVSFVKQCQDTAAFSRHVERIPFIKLVSFLKISSDLNPRSYTLVLSRRMWHIKKTGCMSIESFQLTQRLFSTTSLFVVIFLWSLNELT